MTENKLERWQQENYDKLKAAVGIDLTESEDKTLQWLAGWDHYTMKNIISIIQKLKRCALAGTEHCEEEYCHGPEE